VIQLISGPDIGKTRAAVKVVSYQNSEAVARLGIAVRALSVELLEHFKDQMHQSRPVGSGTSETTQVLRKLDSGHLHGRTSSGGFPNRDSRGKAVTLPSP